MSDPQKPEDRAPRPGAGDAARTQQIPRLGRDGKPVRAQKTVADALREARQSPEASTKNESNGTSRRPAGPARPAASGRPSSSASPSQSSAAKPAPKTPAAKPSEKPADTTAPRDKAAPGAPRSGAASAAAKRAEAKKAAEAKKTSQSPRTSETTPAKPPASGSSTATSSTSSRSSTPTAGDYARTTRQSPDSTAVIPAVKDDAPAATSPAPAASAASAASTSGRQARLRLTHVEPWSVTRLAFVVSVALMIVSVVAVTIFWVVLDLTGIWDQLNGTVTNVLSDSEGSFDLTDYLGLGRLVGLTLVFSAINVVLMTAIATIAAHLYNLAAQLLGGIQVTFSDD